MAVTVTLQQALDIALQHHAASRFAEAETIYRQLLAIHPQNPDLWHLLGLIEQAAGRPDAALRLIQQAIAANPGASAYHNNLGLLLNALGRRAEAEASFREAIRLQPLDAETYYNLGITLSELQRAEEAVAVYRTALRLQPAHASARLNLGLALTLAGRMDEAMAHYREVLRLDPGHTAVAVNLANLLKDSARLDEAIDLYRTAVHHAPADPAALNNLAVALKDHGEIEPALDGFRRSLALHPDSPEIHSNLIFTSFFRSTLAPDEIGEEMRRWNARHALPLRAEWQPHPNDPTPDRPLRIGYVSPDLRDHVVGRTLLPCFEAHDRQQFELFCYSDVPVPDAITERYRALSTGWCQTSHLSAAQLAAQIRLDRIDILVDLALHTAFNQLPVFARKPAPVQIAWLGYPGATGLEAIDYRITDTLLDPPGEDRAGSLEQPLRLPAAWTCYRPPPHSPAVSPLPAATQGHVTFGSFNNFAKINDRVLGLWARILAQIPDSRLLLVAKGRHQEKTRRFFAERGISPDRLEFLAYYPSPQAQAQTPAQPPAAPPPAPPPYLLRYHRIDIALDPFPYNGMTTTCDALWMGVPVIALIGEATLGRASYSLLANLGLPELAAASEEAYLHLATALAADWTRLTTLRATLRDRMQQSPLVDAPRFARALESAYRHAWTRWCESRAPTSGS